MSRKTSEEMFPLVEEYMKSSLTKDKYCEQVGLRSSTLSYWITRYRKQQLSEGSFVALNMHTEMKQHFRMEIRMIDGTLLSFSEPVSPSYVHALLGKR